MSAVRLVAAQTDELADGRLDELSRLCEAAFGRPFGPIWRRVGPGLHVVAEADGRAVAHAMIVDRRLRVGPDPRDVVDVGYVENVATLPEAQGRGHGAAVMREIGAIIVDEYALGALATTHNAFYARQGWETWTGPTSVWMPDGERVRSPDQDGNVMVLRTPRSPTDLDLDAPIAIEWRPEAPW